MKINDLSDIFELLAATLWLVPDFAWSDRLEDRIHFQPTGRSFDQGKSTCRDGHPGLATSGLTCQITAGGNSQIQELLI
jgi:hypothetical protein